MDFNTRLDPKCPEFVENNLIHKEITKKNITYIIILRCRSSFFQKKLHFPPFFQWESVIYRVLGKYCPIGSETSL